MVSDILYIGCYCAITFASGALILSETRCQNRLDVQRSCFDALDDEIILNIIGKIGGGIYLGSVPHPPAALVPVPNHCCADVQTEITCTPKLVARTSPQDRVRASGSHIHTHYPDEEAAKDSDAVGAGAALQALACLNRRFRWLVFSQCSTCVCTVPTLIPHAVRNMPSHLTGLDLHHCGGLLHDHQCEPLRQLSSLQRLSLSSCVHLTGVTLAYLSKASQLTWLDLSNCRCASAVDDLLVTKLFEPHRCTHNSRVHTGLSKCMQCYLKSVVTVPCPACAWQSQPPAEQHSWSSPHNTAYGHAGTCRHLDSCTCQAV